MTLRILLPLVSRPTLRTVDAVDDVDVKWMMFFPGRSRFRSVVCCPVRNPAILGDHSFLTFQNYTNNPYCPKMHAIGEPFVELASTESTNTLAMREADSGKATPGTAWFAHEQTAGRGQRGRAWQSEPGSNLALSILLAPPSPDPSNAFPLSAATVLACLDALGEVGLSDLFVKWPNDIYHGDRKMGGILIENVVRGSRWIHAVAGIGINVNQTRFDAGLPNPVSIRQAMGVWEDPVALARTICKRLETRLNLLDSEGAVGLMEEFNGRLYGAGRQVEFRKDGVVFRAVPRKVLPDGLLSLEGESPMTFRHGEVEWVLNSGT
jgi:BirA family biotin operon repressor/biotin-[acetyl-CoA-carboxylase] ligase